MPLLPSLTLADAAGIAGLALFAAGALAALRLPAAAAGRPRLEAAAALGFVLWGLALFAAWYAWSAPARTCAVCGEPLTLAVEDGGAVPFEAEQPAGLAGLDARAP
jgi:hypothetical protein